MRTHNRPQQGPVMTPVIAKVNPKLSTRDWGYTGSATVLEGSMMNAWHTSEDTRKQDPSKSHILECEGCATYAPVIPRPEKMIPRL